MKDEILKWFATGRVGASSKAMARCFVGIEANDKSHPYDPSDFNRCLLFLQAVPGARRHLDKLRPLSLYWNALVENWSEVEDTFLTEAGLNWTKAWAAPATYRLMKQIYKNAQEAQD